MASARHILLVDDNSDLTHALSRLLENRGFLVSTASTATAALDRWRREKPEIVLLDLHLPDLSGDQLLRTIDEEDLSIDPSHLILFTGESASRIDPDILKRGRHLQKPVEFAVLENFLPLATGN